MEDSSKKRSAKSEDPVHQLALEFGDLLKAKVQPNRRIVINEEPQSFQIPLDTKKFKAALYLAQETYYLEADHRKGEKALRGDGIFCVSLKSPDRKMFIMEKSGAVSEALGIEVYRQGFVDDETLVKHLLSTSVRKSLEGIDFKPVLRCFFSPIQLRVTAQVTTAAKSAEQVRMFLGLMEELKSSRRGEA